METSHSIHWPQFYTATIYQWLPLLDKDKYKDIIVNSLQFLVNKKRITLNAFVIMVNHIHFIWQALPQYDPSKIQLSFMKFTAQQFKFELMKDDPALLKKFKVNKTDREYQFWKRKPLGVELFTASVFKQKLDYIHYNPVRAGLCSNPEDYHYSSALFYHTGFDKFDMLSHYMG